MAEVGRVRWRMLALMFVGTVVIYVDRNTLGALAPILKKELNFTTEQYSYVVSSFQIVYSFAQPVAGYLTDLIGPRVGYAVAAVIWGGAAALHGLSTGWLSMAAFRALLGLSEAVAIPTGTKVSTIWFPTKERSIATGWFNSGSSTARRSRRRSSSFSRRRQVGVMPSSSPACSAFSSRSSGMRSTAIRKPIRGSRRRSETIFSRAGNSTSQQNPHGVGFSPSRGFSAFSSRAF